MSTTTIRTEQDAIAYLRENELKQRLAEKWSKVARKRGSKARTLRGLLQYVGPSGAAGRGAKKAQRKRDQWPSQQQWKLSVLGLRDPRAPKPWREFSDAERDARRAEHDPEFRSAWLRTRPSDQTLPRAAHERAVRRIPQYRRAWIARVRQALATIDMASVSWDQIEQLRELRERALTLVPRAKLPEVAACGVVQLIHPRQWYALSPRQGSRRPKDWTCDGSWDAIAPAHEAGHTRWKNGTPRAYTRASSVTYVPARWWAVDVGIAVKIADRETTTIPAGPEGYEVTAMPDGRVLWSRLDVRDGVRWRVESPVSIDGCQVARRLVAPTSWLVSSWVPPRIGPDRHYHATGCATAEDAIRAARDAWAAQDAERAPVDPTGVRVTLRAAQRAGYCRPGAVAWLQGIGIQASEARMQIGIPAPVLIRRAPDDQRLRRVVAVAARMGGAS